MLIVFLLFKESLFKNRQNNTNNKISLLMEIMHPHVKFRPNHLKKVNKKSMNLPLKFVQNT